MLKKVGGKKTYAVCVVAILYAIAGIWLGDLEIVHAGEIVLAALGAAGIRHGIK